MQRTAEEVGVLKEVDREDRGLVIVFAKDLELIHK